MYFVINLGSQINGDLESLAAINNRKGGVWIKMFWVEKFLQTYRLMSHRNYGPSYSGLMKVYSLLIHTKKIMCSAEFAYHKYFLKFNNLQLRVGIKIFWAEKFQKSIMVQGGAQLFKTRK